MIVIEVENTAFNSRTGTGDDGKPWTINEQQILITGHLVGGFVARHPRESTIRLDDKNPTPYPVGTYAMSADSFFFGNFGRLSLGRVRLQPITQFFAELEKQLGMKVQAVKAA